MAVNSTLHTNVYLQPLQKEVRSRYVLFKDLDEFYPISGLLLESDPEWVMREQWDYVVSVRFDGVDSLRGQLAVNGTQIFDSYTTGTGTNRTTTAWGKVSAGSSANMYQGVRKYSLHLRLTGTGSVRINGPLIVEWVRVRK